MTATMRAPKCANKHCWFPPLPGHLECDRCERSGPELSMRQRLARWLRALRGE